MRKILMFLTVLFLVSSVFSVRAQQLNQKATHQVATFDLGKKGTKKVYLPPSISGGDVISGTVVDEPKGKNDRQRQKNSSVLEGYVFEVENGENEQGDGFLKTIFPLATSGGLAYLTLKDKGGNVVDKIPIPVDPAIPEPPVDFTPAPGDIVFPEVTQAGQPTVIRGSFDGDFTNTDVYMNDQPVPFICEGPDGLVVETPKDMSGVVDIELVEQDLLFTGQCNNVAVTLAADNLYLKRGQRANLTMTLDGIPEDGPPLQVAVANLTTSTVNLSGGNIQTITIDPAVSGNSYITDFVATAKQVGGFVVQATILDQTDPVVRLMYPNNDEELETDQSTFIWRSGDLPPTASYTFVLYRRSEEEAVPGIPVSGEQEIFRQPGVTGNSYTLPVSVAQQLEDHTPFRWDIIPDGNMIFSLRGDGQFRKNSSKERCKCESIAVKVKVTNESGGDPVEMEADMTVRSRTHRMYVQRTDEDFSYQNGDRIRIEISGVEVGCTCGEAKCKTEGTKRRDRDRNAIIDLGENDHDASNDNYNFVRLRNSSNGWNNGTFTINGQVRDENSSATGVYQCFWVKAWCTHDNCRGKALCKQRFTIVLGSI